MKLIPVFIFAILIHEIYAIDVKFPQSDFYKGIKRIEIPSCNEEPCNLQIGKPLPAIVTFGPDYSGIDKQSKGISDINLRIYVNYYRDRYQYNFAYCVYPNNALQINSLCNIKANVMEQDYSIDANLFISTEGAAQSSVGFPETGIKDVYFDVYGTTSEGVKISGSAVVKINVTN